MDEEVRGIFKAATVALLPDGRVAFTVRSETHPGVENTTILPQEIAVSCIADDIAGPILAGTKSLRPFK